MNIKEYEKIIKEIEEKDIGAITKLEIVSHMMGFDIYENLKDINKEKLLDFLYSYWMESDLIEHTLYDYTEAIFNSSFYGFPEIVENIENLSYKDFVNIIEKNNIL